MAQKRQPWTVAIVSLLDDGAWHDKDEVLAAGAAVVTEERALQEIKGRNETGTEERRLAAGKRAVAQQALMGLLRFGDAEQSRDKKQVRKSEALTNAELTTLVRQLQQQVEALENTSPNNKIASSEGTTVVPAASTFDELFAENASSS